MRYRALVLAAIVVLAVGGSQVLAQTEGSTGTMEGLITDPQQVALPGATVEVTSASTGVQQAALTDGDGRYKITGLKPATDYVLSVSFTGGGYAKVTQDRIVVRADRTTVESVQLFQERTEEVIVSAKRETGRVVDLEQIGQVTEFSSEFLEGLPLLGRNYQDILTLAAGVSDHDDDGNPNVLGARAENFTTVIDGVSNQDPLGGTFLSNLNTDAIESVEVITTGADASFRRSSGGFANIITKSGSNEFEGTFTLAFRSSLLDGNGQTGNEDADFKSIRPAVTLSGALKKDKLWGFMTWEQYNDDNPVNTLSGENTLIQETNGYRVLGKLTWQVNSSNKLAFSVRANPLEFTNLGVNSLVLEEAGFTQEQGGPIWNAQLDSVFSPTLLLKSTIGLVDTGIDVTPTNPQDPLDTRRFLSNAYDINLDTNATTGSFFVELSDKRERFTWAEDLTYFVDDFYGRHDIAVGVSYDKEHYESDLYQGMFRTFRLVNNLFGSDNPNVGGNKQFRVTETFGIPLETKTVDGNLVQGGGFNHLEGDSDNYGVYISDTWLPRDNLSINVGLRWDREEVTADGFEQFDVEQEFNDFKLFLAECLSAVGQAPPQAANNLIAQRFPDEYAAFLANGSALANCESGKAFFYTYPKKKFTDDCISPEDNSLCTDTLNNFRQALAVIGNRPEKPVDITNDNLAPRFTVSWDPWSNGKTKLFGSYGKFFDKTNLATATAEQGPDTRSRTFTFTEGLNTVTGQNNASDPTVSLVDRNIRTQFNEEWTVGLEREVAPETKLRLTYIRRRFEDQTQDVDFNHFVRDVGPEFLSPVRREVGGFTSVVGFIPRGGSTTCEFDPAVEGLVPTKGNVPGVGRSIVRIGDAEGPNGNADDCFGAFAVVAGNVLPTADGVPDLFRRNLLYNNVLFLSNLNFTDFEGATLEFTRRMKRNWQLQASWTWSQTFANADNFQDESGNDPSLVADEFGYAGFDIRNVVTVSVLSILPWGDVQLGSIMRYLSGTPYSFRNQELSFDSAGEGTFRTVFPTGARNDQRNESHILIDVSAEKSFLIKKYNATAQFVVENLLADDFLVVNNFVNGQIQATRDFGRQYEVRFKINF